jgi:hypothetical protein
MTEAKRILAEKTLGKVRTTNTAFEDASDAFLKECESRLRPVSVKLYRRHLSTHYPFGRKSVAFTYSFGRPAFRSPSTYGDDSLSGAARQLGDIPGEGLSRELQFLDHREVGEDRLGELLDGEAAFDREHRRLVLPAPSVATLRGKDCAEQLAAASLGNEFDHKARSTPALPFA